ncbi:MAG: hypothetical protein A2527_06495 [Candidatus Lambdaproteobacteria bacterium RIFOXYD2_FULL_50_16]|uniref:CheW-like domain-containing protein n=1 Tax=Candidatus Lambdaproteobacteria bacterium RIFOXYD2_FULL_50_16 TaxID=1817772 RepID=A0A1F6GA63_9PROT|nr:MAG: hypothetical protein A2527_06495 [Candidatus Lambdaproteobacteria bacterium RIFOXYD2_FULL_50_16]
MNGDSLLVFKEQDFLFGISPSDFDQPFTLDQLNISPSGVDKAIWYYQDRVHKKEGIFLHLGALFGLRPVSFSYKGMIFLNEMAPNIHLGIFVDHLILKLPLLGLDSKTVGVEEAGKLPPELPSRAIRKIVKHHRKTILLVDPVQLTEVYQLISPERIRNLLAGARR